MNSRLYSGKWQTEDCRGSFTSQGGDGETLGRVWTPSPGAAVAFDTTSLELHNNSQVSRHVGFALAVIIP